MYLAHSAEASAKPLTRALSDSMKCECHYFVINLLRWPAFGGGGKSFHCSSLYPILIDLSTAGSKPYDPVSITKVPLLQSTFSTGQHVRNTFPPKSSEIAHVYTFAFRRIHKSFSNTWCLFLMRKSKLNQKHTQIQKITNITVAAVLLRSGQRISCLRRIASHTSTQ